MSVRLALLGSPNSGKTTLFNALTGLRAKTGNYPGVTVDRRLGAVDTGEGEITLIDLPGTYSLHAVSEDEAVAVRVLKGEMGEAPPDGIVMVADATTLQRSLPMLAEILQLGRPTLLVLTMIDELKARGGDYDLFLFKKLLGIPVLGVVGNRGLGITDLRENLADPSSWARPASLPEPNTEARFAWADDLLHQVERHPVQESGMTRAMDRILLHPVLGMAVFFAFLAIFFQAIFSWAAPAMDLFAGTTDALADWVLHVFPPGLLTKLLADGIIRGVGAVLVFVPQIALLFALIFFFEASGYMARAAFVVDRIMGWAGLEGRCFIALLSSYACSVPGIMATRSIPSPRDRLATILVAPFATCSARLPVYALLISAFIPDTKILGPFTLQGLALMGLYILGGVSAILFAALFKRGLLRGASLPFYLELPPYRFPSIKSIAVQVWRRLRVFLQTAGSIILIGSILLWVLLNFPQTETPDHYTPAQAQAHPLENSWAANIGHSMEPIFAPLGYDWRINIGLVASFAARELMVSTLAQVYAYPDDGEEFAGLGQLLSRNDPITGKPPLTLASAMSLLVFFVYALLCLSTFAVVKRETNTWRWPVFMMTYMFAVAWVGAWATYQIFI